MDGRKREKIEGNMCGIIGYLGDKNVEEMKKTVKQCIVRDHDIVNMIPKGEVKMNSKKQILVGSVNFMNLILKKGNMEVDHTMGVNVNIVQMSILSYKLTQKLEYMNIVLLIYQRTS